MNTHDLVEIFHEIDFCTKLPKWGWRCTRCGRKCWWGPESVSEELLADPNFTKYISELADRERLHMQNQKCEGTKCPNYRPSVNSQETAS